MIRTVPIPTGGRIGCTSCGLQGIHTNRRIQTPGEGARNSALRARLGDTQCDSDGNCYTDGVLTTAPLTTGTGCAPGVASCGTSATGSNSTMWYLGIGLAAVLLLELTSRRR